ncbi:MAG: A/G-specific adenine glycosylase [Cryomorphaceae bacterium]|nr:MAG: A/G-specific adenine glycosylase [Cryomorphaceae bacterium]
MKLKFSEKLIEWYRVNKRNLPWRLTKQPYKIWVSEIILQQTRIEQGEKYYYAFLEKYPNISELAKTNDEELLKVWEGLGYYSRALNMLKASRVVLNNYKGIFPSNYDDLIKLPGIGDYTASAISSICNNEVQPVVDGNVFRFLSRMFKIDLPIDKLKTKTYFKKLGFKLIDVVNPGDFNQAMMDYGSMVCRPKKFQCHKCLFSSNCKAFNSNTVMLYPFKEKRIKIKHRFLNYIFIITNDRKTLIKKRNGNGIWKNLYEFPLIETKKESSVNEIIKELDFKYLKFISEKKIKHKLTHQQLNISFFTFKVSNFDDDLTDIKALSNYPFPRPINKFISELV